MSFLPQFSKYFTSEQRETELYNIWAAIGVNTEKAILEEFEKTNSEMTDINAFTEDTLRSWLGFFLQKIPYRTTATTQITAKLVNEYSLQTGYKYAQTTIPIYSQLNNLDGYVYTTMQEIILSGNDERTVTAVQGRRVVEQGTYNSIIKVQATNPDLSYMTVTLNGKEIPEVSYQTSYDNLTYLGSWKPESGSEGFGGTPFLQNSYGTKGQFYTVIADGYCKFSEDSIPIEFRLGDIVVFDGVQWQRSASTNNLQPIQFANSYAIPYNGYFAYYYGGFLYIKIYAGTEVDNPQGLQYTVSYISSDGILGETKQDTLSFISTYQDVNEHNVELEVRNTESSVAVNEPGVGKLGIYLKQRLYGGINVSSVPEYTAWFKSQPEVGDCMVLSDWERYKRSGQYTLTGYIDVFLTDNNGNNISQEIGEQLLDRIEPYKDIGVLRLYEFKTIKNHYEFRYTSVNGDDAFQQYIKSVVGQYYSLPYLQSINSSLFESVDLASVVNTIQLNANYKSTGLTVKGYHYWSNVDDRRDITSRSFTIDSFEGEKPGDGWYLARAKDSDGNVIAEYKFIEDAEANGICGIYDINNYAYSVGSHIGQVVSFNLPESYSYALLEIECYWGMANEGILAIGSQEGLRKLQSVNIERVS